MDAAAEQAAQGFIEGMSRIGEFWGFPRAMGAVYGAIYLSPEPMTLDDLVERISISKGAASTHVRSLERLKMIHKHVRVGDRKDYYDAETDLWSIVKSIMREREQREFDSALRTVGESLDVVRASKGPEAAFLAERMKAMQMFFKSIDSMVSTVLAIDELKSSKLGKIFGAK